MIHIMDRELTRINETDIINPIFIDQAVDFIRIYADKTHHGKEEDILFRDLAGKQLSQQHSKTMDELIEEHKHGRQAVTGLLDAKTRHRNGEEGVVEVVKESLRYLVNFYPKHIDKEDNHFFQEVMNYFSEEERDRMLDEGRTFNRKMIHLKYDTDVSGFEEGMGVAKPKRPTNWLDYL